MISAFLKPRKIPVQDIVIEKPCSVHRDDGIIVTDNCPFRPTRKRITAYAAAALLVFTWCLALNASAQGLVGVPIDPRCGQRTAVGLIADYGHETVRDISRIFTGISLLVVIFVPLAEHKKDRLNILITELIALAAIPLLIHLACIYVINNFG